MIQNTAGVPGITLHEFIDLSKEATDTNHPPVDLNTSGELSVMENSPIGTVVGSFVAFDPDGDDLNFTLVSGQDEQNANFTIDANGVLRTAKIFDAQFDFAFQNIRVQASDESGASVEAEFVVVLKENLPPQNPGDFGRSRNVRICGDWYRDRTVCGG